jgi:hypothetical protein
MSPSWYRTILRALGAAVVFVACLGSFVTGYYVGFSEAWNEARSQDEFTFEAVQEYLKNHPSP